MASSKITTPGQHAETPKGPVAVTASSARSERSAAEAVAEANRSVTILGALPPWRGVAPYTRHLVEGLETRDGLDIEFLDFSSLYPPRFYPGGEPMDPKGTAPSFQNVRVRRLLAWYNPLSWLWAGLTLRGPVVHAQWWSFILAPVYVTVLALARLRGRKIVLTLHNIQPHEGGRWQHWLYRCVFRFAHHFIVHAERNAQELVSIYPPAEGRVSVVAHGLLSVAATRELTSEQARRELGLPLDRPVILAFGNIRAYKGLDVLLRAFRRLLNAGQEATLVIAGQPWNGFQSFQDIIDELDLDAHVHTWLEFVPDQQVEALFAAADLAVFPYRHFEAQSGATTLALSFGVPILVSDVGGLSDLVDDPRAVVPPNDPEALAGAMCAVLDDERLHAKLAMDARRQAAELDWTGIARQTEEVYQAVIAS